MWSCKNFNMLANLASPADYLFPVMQWLSLQFSSLFASTLGERMNSSSTVKEQVDHNHSKTSLFSLLAWCTRELGMTNNLASNLGDNVEVEDMELSEKFTLMVPPRRMTFFRALLTQSLKKKQNTLLRLFWTEIKHYMFVCAVSIEIRRFQQQRGAG